MDREEAVSIARRYLKLVSQELSYDRAYLFGSYAEGQQCPESDVDIGIVVSHLDRDYLETMKRLYRIRRHLDVRIEPHLFVLDHDRSGFSDYVVQKGIQL